MIFFFFFCLLALDYLRAWNRLPFLVDFHIKFYWCLVSNFWPSINAPVVENLSIKSQLYSSTSAPAMPALPTSCCYWCIKFYSFPFVFRIISYDSFITSYFSESSSVKLPNKYKSPCLLACFLRQILPQLTCVPFDINFSPAHLWLWIFGGHVVSQHDH